MTPLPLLGSLERELWGLVPWRLRPPAARSGAASTAAAGRPLMPREVGSRIAPTVPWQRRGARV